MVLAYNAHSVCIVYFFYTRTNVKKARTFWKKQFSSVRMRKNTNKMMVGCVSTISFLPMKSLTLEMVLFCWKYSWPWRLLWLHTCRSPVQRKVSNIVWDIKRLDMTSYALIITDLYFFVMKHWMWDSQRNGDTVPTIYLYSGLTSSKTLDCFRNLMCLLFFLLSFLWYAVLHDFLSRRTLQDHSQT